MSTFEVSVRAEQFPEAKKMLDLYKRYRIRGFNLRYRSDIRGAMATWTQLNFSCVRLACSPIAYAGEYSATTDTDDLRMKGFYREFVLQRDFAINRKTLIVNGASANPTRNPWLADPKLDHYGLLFKYCNLSPEYQTKVPRSGKFYITAYIEFRDRKLSAR